MIQKIGIQNFRVFKEFTEFQIRPITLLVGPNNAGKSSFTKLLLLLKNGVSKLNFEEGIHNLESFEKVLNWESKNEFIKIRYDNKIDFLNESFHTDTIYFRDYMMAINISNGIENLLTFTTASNGKTYELNFNIILMISLIYNDKTSGFWEIDDNREFSGWMNDNDGDGYEFNHTLYEGDLSLENYLKVFEDGVGFAFEGKQQIGKIVLKHEFKNLEKDYLLYDIFVNGEKATQYYKEKIIELQILEFSKVETSIENSIIQSLESALLFSNGEVKYNIEKYFSNILNNEDVEIKETRLGRLLFEEKLFESTNDYSSKEYHFSVDKKVNYQKTFFQQFSTFYKGLEEDFADIHYISANRGSQKRILANKSENDIDQIVLDFFKISDKNIIYLEKIFDILEISGKLTVERFENVISIVYLTINERKVALSDVGFGYSQLIPIILKLSTLTSSDYNKVNNMTPEKEWEFKRSSVNFRNRNIVIIEEPEANLHPSLQSKLADMFVATIEYYPFINFIIETHSEYLIRKLQFLTAKKEIETDKSIIYYFNADKYVTAIEPKVKPIEIRANGNLSDTFGPGFYDEISRLQFELLKLNQEQNN